MLLVPAVMLGAAVLTAARADSPSGGLVRTLFLAGAYLLYLGAFVGVTLAVSARARSARFALVALLGFWVFVCLAAPRAATDLAKALYPTPSVQEFAAALAEEKETGIGGVDYDDFLEARKQELLAEYGVDDVEALPINYAGWRFQVSEEYGNQFFDRHYARLWDQFEAQDGFRQKIGFAAPLLAVRSLSMSLAGSDFAHFRRFAEQAEQYRRRLVAFLNDDMRDHAGAGFSYRGDQGLWSKAPAFAYDAPDPVWAVSGQSTALAALVVWRVLSAVLARSAAARLEVS